MTQMPNIGRCRGFIQGWQVALADYCDIAGLVGETVVPLVQYQAQDMPIRMPRNASIELTLFHGRGGSGKGDDKRGHLAIGYPPPGSLKGGLRVTEQGEMIRSKYGLPEVAPSSRPMYTSVTQNGERQRPAEPDVKDRRSAAQQPHHRAYFSGGNRH
ncbi:phosphoenolpyruvate carboxylase [Klebsiella pneumoniae]|uniref:phosphoenolpyruvate carboxylase n=1 Tax=Klebsiella pneumoniae TaxID=573 RepID=UPI003986F1CB